MNDLKTSRYHLRRRSDGWSWGIAMCAIGLAVLVIHAKLVRFIPAPQMPLTVVLLIAVVLGWMLWRLLITSAQRRNRWQPPSDFRSGCILLFAPVCLGIAIYPVLEKSAPWAWTKLFGVPNTWDATVRTHYRNSRRSCDFIVQGGPLRGLFGSELCISEAAYNAHPEQTVRVRLVGLRSPFGFQVDSIEILEFKTLEDFKQLFSEEELKRGVPLDRATSETLEKLIREDGGMP